MNKTRIAIISTITLIVLLAVAVIDYSLAIDLSDTGLPIGLKGIAQIVILIISATLLSKEFNKEIPTSTVFKLALKVGLILLTTFLAHLLILQQLEYLSTIFPATYSPVVYFLINSAIFGLFGFIISMIVLNRQRRSTSSI